MALGSGGALAGATSPIVSPGFNCLGFRNFMKKRVPQRTIARSHIFIVTKLQQQHKSIPGLP
jgi:hypothetical protein